MTLVLSFRMKHCYNLGAEMVEVTFTNQRTTIVGPCGGGKSTILRGIFDVFRAFSSGASRGKVAEAFQIKANDGAYALLQLSNLCWIGYFDRPRTSTGELKEVAMSEFPENYAHVVVDDGLRAKARHWLQVNQFGYCPQDHGLRYPDRISSLIAPAVLESVSSPHVSMILSQGCKKSFTKITGLCVSDASVDLQFSFNDQPAFDISGLCLVTTATS